MLNIRSSNDMDVAIVSKLELIRNFYPLDVVVGIPRSGIIPAATIALHLQLPYADIGSYANNIAFDTSGKIYQSSNAKRRILLVDDTVNTGKSMNQAIQYLRKSGCQDQIITYAVWHSDKTNMNLVNISTGLLPRPRAFEWNMWKHHRIGKWATDMDGVLCRDPSKKENDRGEKLFAFYDTAPLKFKPDKKIKYIITARLEKYREVTVRWLAKNNITYDRLFMKNNDQKHALYKSDIIKNLTDIELYIESDPKQARVIAEQVNIPIYCTDTQTVYNKGLQ